VVTSKPTLDVAALRGQTAARNYQVYRSMFRTGCQGSPDTEVSGSTDQAGLRRLGCGAALVADPVGYLSTNIWNSLGARAATART
jgi:hypothetical protein